MPGDGSHQSSPSSPPSPRSHMEASVPFRTVALQSYPAQLPYISTTMNGGISSEIDIADVGGLSSENANHTTIYTNGPTTTNHASAARSPPLLPTFSLSHPLNLLLMGELRPPLAPPPNQSASAVKDSASLRRRAQTENAGTVGVVSPTQPSTPSPTSANTTTLPQPIKYRNQMTSNQYQAQYIEQVRSRKQDQQLAPTPPDHRMNHRSSLATTNSNSQSNSSSTLIGSLDDLYAMTNISKSQKESATSPSSVQLPSSTHPKEIANIPIPPTSQQTGLFHRGPSISSALQYRNNTSHSIVDYQYYRKGGSSLHSANEFIQSFTQSIAKTSFNSRMSEINRRNYWKFGKEKVLFLAVNAVFTLAGACIFILTMFSWSDANWYGPLARVVQPDVLAFSTAIGILILGIGLIGLIGAFSHNKTMVGFFTLVAVPIFIFTIVNLYISYKWINDARWEQNFAARYTYEYSNKTRLLIQNKFGCCGFYAAADESVVYDGVRCIEGVQLSFGPTQGPNQFDTPVLSPPCYQPYNDFSHSYLRFVYIVCIGLLPLTLAAFMAGMLATNHIYD